MYSKVDVIWAAACEAHVINGGYIGASSANPQNKRFNKHIMLQLISEPSSISEASFEKGKDVQAYLKGLVFQMLSDSLTYYSQKLVRIASTDYENEEDVVPEIGIIASAPRAVEKHMEREYARSNIENSTGGYIGNIGDRVQLEITILKVVYSEQWNCYYINALTSTDSVVLFSSSKNELQRIKSEHLISATVRSHEENDGYKLTRLSRIKIMKRGK